jgi:hypothetical protein
MADPLTQFYAGYAAHSHASTSSYGVNAAAPTYSQEHLLSHLAKNAQQHTQVEVPRSVGGPPASAQAASGSHAH